jgi:hypothetical protein
VDAYASFRFLHLLLDATFQVCFESTPLVPGAYWVVPMACSRELSGRQHPHWHCMYIMGYQAHQAGFTFDTSPEEHDDTGYVVEARRTNRRHYES